MLTQLRPAIVMIVAADRDHRAHLSARHDRHCAGSLPASGQGSLIEKRRHGHRLALIGQNFAERPLLPWPALGDDRRRSDRRDQDGVRPLQCGELGRLESRPDQQGADRAGARGCRDAEGREPIGRRFPIDLVTTSAAGSTRISRPKPRSFRCRASRRRADCPKTAVRKLVDRAQRRLGICSGFLGEPRVNVSGAQPRARRRRDAR